MDNIAGLLSLFLIGAAFLSSCNAPQAPGGSGSEPVLLMSKQQPRRRDAEWRAPVPASIIW
jgi:hypothetical protein